MAITGISSIDNKQIIAAGALSATSANQALVTSGGDSLQGLYDTVSTNSGSWTGGGGGGSVTSPSGTIIVNGSNIEATNSAVGTIVTPSASALLGNDVYIAGLWDPSPSVFNFTLPVSGGTLYAVRTMWYGTDTFNFSGKDLNGNIETGTMTVPGEPGTYTANLNEIVSDLSAQGIQGNVRAEQLYVTSPSASNSGVHELAWKSDVPTGNVFTGYNTYTSGYTSYSAVVDTDYKLTAGNDTYSLIGAYTNANNKFNKVSGSNTLFEYSSHYEMGNKAYKPDILGTTGANRTEANPRDIYVEFQFNEWPITAKIDKVYLTFDATKSGTVNDSKWELLSSNNNHYEFVKYHPLGEYNQGMINEHFTFDYNSWGTITNATASADIYSAFGIKELAFKDDLTGGSVPDEVMSAASAVSANSANWNEISAYQSAGDYYSASNPSGFITGVPDTYLQNTDLEISDNKITGISGVPLAAGGDVPEGVMVESGLEYNAVNEISAYNGSAIAQYGAEKQWLVHDDTLVHAANSAQYALGVAIDNVARLMGVDETLLFSSSPTNFTTAFTASESIANFDRIRVSQMLFTDNEYITENHEYETDGVLLTNKLNVGFNYVIDNGWKCWGAEKYHITNGTDFTMYRAGRNFIGPNTTASQGYNDTIQSANGWVYKVIGVGRKQ